MDFTEWADWVRALIGAVLTCLGTAAIWRVVRAAAAHSDPHRRTGRHVALVPRRLVRLRTAAVGRRLRAATAVRRHQGLGNTTPAADFRRHLAEADRSERVLRAGSRVWSLYVPLVLALCGVTLGTWALIWEYAMAGPLSDLLDTDTLFYESFDQATWFAGYDEECRSFSLFRGCEPAFLPWWSGFEAGFDLGVAVALPVAAWRLRRSAAAGFRTWLKQEAPDLRCLEALAACRDALRPTAPEATVLDERVSELRTALEDFAAAGVPADTVRRTELQEHTAQVTEALGKASGRYLREGSAALPALIALLATVQDRVYARRWLALLAPAQLGAAPPPGPVPAQPQHAVAAAQRDPGRWQRLMPAATALPAIPALLALAFTAVTISQASDTLDLTQRDQVSSVYNETVSNLGDDAVNVRVSSIYGIERMMRENPGEQPTLVGVLCSYVREHAKTPKNKRELERRRKDEKARPTEDVQAALSVLGRVPSAADMPRIDLRNTSLIGAEISSTNFANADLRGADLTHADLRLSQFGSAWFDGARLSGALLSDADFSAAEFIGTDLSGVWWDGAVLVGADLSGANLSHASLFHRDDGAVTNLERADLSGARLTGADLTGAALREADFTKDDSRSLGVADVDGANFTGADLTDAHLAGVDGATAVWDQAVLPRGRPSVT
ncbi:pentapeptide repeat-containing protein [Streptomyces ziwulingensis]|uniref:Pentapeptide repeat-containing protein n=1 Tax=Streptomyces ziwulingensis TaxID=1045501 RepID=A0ABP9C9Z8_9ACTN